ncbi:avidin-like [Pelodytes ibericus]
MKLSEVLAVALLFICVSADPQCSIVGHWKNELGSNMTIEHVTDDGFFSGMYLTAVTAQNTAIIVSPLIGFQHTTEHPTFGFAVQWIFSGSVTVWSGQCFQNPKGETFLKTTWLLRSEVEKEDDDWKATSSRHSLKLDCSRTLPYYCIFFSYSPVNVRKQKQYCMKIWAALGLH